jgi:hypothetical protein
MSKNEIKGLQALALANGGSLSINPDTGLVEAGFLEQILPMVAGAGLMLIPGVGPLAAAAIVGGGYGLATGSVEKGLIASSKSTATPAVVWFIWSTNKEIIALLPPCAFIIIKRLNPYLIKHSTASKCTLMIVSALSVIVPANPI